MFSLRSEIVLKDFDDFDDLVIAVVSLEQLAAGYASKDIEVPEWLSEKIRDGNAELDYRRRAHKERKLAELKMKREHLKTRTEQRSETDDEIRKLEEELA